MIIKCRVSRSFFFSVLHKKGGDYLHVHLTTVLMCDLYKIIIEDIRKYIKHIFVKVCHCNIIIIMLEEFVIFIIIINIDDGVDEKKVFVFVNYLIHTYSVYLCTYSI